MRVNFSIERMQSKRIFYNWNIKKNFNQRILILQYFIKKLNIFSAVQILICFFFLFVASLQVSDYE